MPTDAENLSGAGSEIGRAIRAANRGGPVARRIYASSFRRRARRERPMEPGPSHPRTVRLAPVLTRPAIPCPAQERGAFFLIQLYRCKLFFGGSGVPLHHYRRQALLVARHSRASAGAAAAPAAGADFVPNERR